MRRGRVCLGAVFASNLLALVFSALLPVAILLAALALIGVTLFVASVLAAHGGPLVLPPFIILVIVVVCHSRSPPTAHAGRRKRGIRSRNSEDARMRGAVSLSCCASASHYLHQQLQPQPSP